MISRFKRSAASTTTVILRRAALEALESRQLLTVSVDGGILFVTGTSGNDTITILRDPVVKGMLRVSVNGFYNAVDEGAITQIRVDATAPFFTPAIANAPKINPHGSPTYGGPVDGYSPAQIRAGYGFGDLSNPGFTNRGAGQTIAIVDAYNAPTIRQDLAAYSFQFGLTAPSKANFQIYYASKVKPNVNLVWAGETTLDVESAHAIAPDA